MVSRSELDAQIFRDKQGARVARWLRDSEAGNLFIGSRGKTYHLLEDEALELRNQALKIIECGATKKLSPVNKCLLKITALTSLFSTALLLSSSGLAALFSSLIFIASIIAISVGDSVSDWRYEKALRRWREAVCTLLEANRRGGVPVEIALRHRRYNGFQWLMFATMPVIGGIGLWTSYGDSGDAGGALMVLVMCGLLVGIVILDLAAKKVDATHRRRKWLD